MYVLSTIYYERFFSSSKKSFTNFIVGFLQSFIVLFLPLEYKSITGEAMFAYGAAANYVYFLSSLYVIALIIIFFCNIYIINSPNSRFF